MMKIPNHRIEKTLHKGRHYTIYSALRLSDTTPVVMKTPCDAYQDIIAGARLAYEFEIGNICQHKNIVTYIELIKAESRPFLVIEYFDGIRLGDCIPEKGVDSATFFIIARQTLEGLTEIHRRNIIHQLLNPDTIFVNPRTHMVKITDFGRSTYNNYQVKSDLQHFKDSLAYISPEQTGRMNRSIDYRTDFYSLGITFYKMLTGTLPFNSDDTLELVHSQIAKQAVAPHHVNPSVPPIVSEMILKLLSKNADERYQSASGVLYDLEQIYNNADTLDSQNFTIATHDFSDRFQIPQKLYGRSFEIETLLKAFERIKHGRCEFVLIPGYSGVGKTAVVHEIYRPVAESFGYFISSGKYDQYRRNVPYSAITQSFNELCNYFLSESKEQLAYWKSTILEAVGEYGRVLLDVIPNLERIIGPQPAVSDLDPIESQNRFHRIFLQFAKCVSQQEHPLVVFIDDLQWADLASIAIIELLISREDMRYFLLIGAYRDNEVDAAHPFMKMIDTIRNQHALMHHIHITELSFEHVNELVADTLHCKQSFSRPLSTLIYSKTHGNAFFTIQFLTSLYRDNLISFDHDILRWNWDIDHIAAKNITDNVVDLMTSRLHLLNSPTSRLLSLAACIGNTFDLLTLAPTCQLQFDQMLDSLIVISENELITPIDGDLRNIAGMCFEEFRQARHLNVHFKFIHDRVQQAAYLLGTENERKALHLRIGRWLLHNLHDDDIEERVFEIAGHLNEGVANIHAASEKIDLIRLNLQAGVKAKKANATDSAIDFLNAGARLLPASHWETHYDLSMELYLERTDAYIFTSNKTEADRGIGILQTHAHTVIDKIKTLIIAFNQQFIGGSFSSAVQPDIEALKLLGIVLPDNPEELYALAEKKLHAIQPLIENTDWAGLPDMTEPHQILLMKILDKMFNRAYNTGNSDMLAVIAVMFLERALEYGMHEGTSSGFMLYAVIMAARHKNYPKAIATMEKARALAQHVNSKKCLGQILYVDAFCVSHFHQPFRASLDKMLLAQRLCYECGNLIWATVAYIHIANFHRILSNNLQDTVSTYAECIQQVTQNKYIYFADSMKIYLNVFQKLQNESYTALRDYFDRQEFLKQYPDDAIIQFFYRLAECKVRYLFEEYDQAYTIIEHESVEKVKPGFAGTPFMCEYTLFYALLLCQKIASRTQDARDGMLKTIRAAVEDLRVWADLAPCNFRHDYLLLHSEYLRISGADVEQVMNSYDEAIQASQKYGTEPSIALAHELAGKYWSQKGKSEFARSYVQEALVHYSIWGAVSKCHQLVQQYPNLIEREKQGATAPAERLDLDISTIIKATQAISGEVMTDNLLAKLMHIIIENAGAQKGYLVLNTENELFIVAGFHVDRKEHERFHNEKLKHTTLLSEAIVRYVIRTREHVILHNASFEGQFMHDRYIKTNVSKSILAMPIFSKNTIQGALFLENDLTTHVFSGERINLLNIILSQAAISLENAKLFHARIVAEKELRHLRNYLANIINSMPSVLIGVDTAGTVTQWNAEAQRTTGIAADDAVGQPLTQAFPRLTAEMERVRQAIQSRQTLSDPKQTRQEDGEIRYEDVTIYPLIATGVEGAVIRVDDVTERVRIEEMMIQSEKMLSVGGLAAGMAHEINNPLGGMMQTAQVLSNRLTDLELPANQRAAEAAGSSMEAIRAFMEARGIIRMLARISESGRRAAVIVQNMLSFARKSDSTFSTHNLADLLDHTVDLAGSDYNLKKKFDFRQIAIVRDYEENLPNVPCEASKIQQVFFNILRNGAQAMQEETEQEEHKTPRFILRLAYEREAGRVRIEIENNGPSMDEATRKRVFEPFFTTRPVGVGTGLGLSVSYFIITENHGGDMSVESTSGAGTTFIISLPVERRQS